MYDISRLRVNVYTIAKTKHSVYNILVHESLSVKQHENLIISASLGVAFKLNTSSKAMLK